MEAYPIADAQAIVEAAWSTGWAPAAAISVTAWAEDNVLLSGKSAAEPGPYRAERTPYAIEPMNCMTVSSLVQELVLMWGAQTSKSTVLNNCLGYWVDVEPAAAMLVQPTLNLAKRYSRTRVAVLIEDTPALRRKFAAKRSREDSNTTLMKDFEGGVLVIAGANSAADLRSIAVRYLLLDEVDGYPADVDGEGDPCELAEKRQTTYSVRKKTIRTSTPTDELTSRIEPAFNAGSRERFHVPCPACGQYQWLQWRQLKWPSGNPEAAHYECEHCQVAIAERHKATMLPRGVWIAENPGAQNGRVRSFHLSSLYSPLGWASWGELAREFVAASATAAQGDSAKLQVFINTRLAETWKDAGEQTDATAIARRAEPYPLGKVPAGALLLTAACDVQGNRIEVELDGWAAGDENWTVDKVVFWGEPADLLSGKDPRLDDYLRQAFVNSHGHEMRILACAIDSGGHYTHDVYMFCRTRRHRHIFAVKGMSIPGRPVLGKPAAMDINYRGSVLKQGAQLWPVGSDTAKELIFNRLRVEVPGPGYLHFSNELDPEHYQQLTAEKLVTRYHKGRPRREWVLLKGRRNEALDLKVYNFAAAIYAGVTRLPAARWEELRRTLGPSLFTAPGAPAVAVGQAAAAAAEPAAAPAAATPASPTAWLGDRTKNWLGRR